MPHISASTAPLPADTDWTLQLTMRLWFDLNFVDKTILTIRVKVEKCKNEKCTRFGTRRLWLLNLTQPFNLPFAPSRLHWHNQDEGQCNFSSKENRGKQKLSAHVLTPFDKKGLSDSLAHLTDVGPVWLNEKRTPPKMKQTELATCYIFICSAACTENTRRKQYKNLTFKSSKCPSLS